METSDTFLTFVISGNGKCNLRCSFCFIEQRNEISDLLLQPSDVLQFIEDVSRRRQIAALAIQGYEPLLPSSLPFTEVILNAGKRLGLPTSVVTNGVYLRETTALLNDFTSTKIGISVDASAPSVHDRFRGVSGAWNATIKGIIYALSVFHSSRNLSVISVLHPSKIDHLRGMPNLLRTIGIEQWILSPLIRVGHSSRGNIAGDQEKIVRNILVLKEEADNNSIRISVSDEFNNLDYKRLADKFPDLKSIQFRTLSAAASLFRLLPSGHCSTIRDIMKKQDFTMPRWYPGNNAADFLESLEN